MDKIIYQSKRSWIGISVLISFLFLTVIILLVGHNEKAKLFLIVYPFLTVFLLILYLFHHKLLSRVKIYKDRIEFKFIRLLFWIKTDSFELNKIHQINVTGKFFWKIRVIIKGTGEMQINQYIEMYGFRLVDLIKSLRKLMFL